MKKTFNVSGEIILKINKDIDASSEEEAIKKVIQELNNDHRITQLEFDASDLCADEYDED